MAARKPTDQSATGKTPNQYIPSFITKKPFYVDESTSEADYLDHQRLQTPEERRRSEKWYDRGKKAGPVATKFRKGACDNCGAMTHGTKDCLSRPRKAGARWTGRDIEADEKVQQVSLGWDAKRDRWNGYDASEYQNVVDDYNRLEEMKRAARGENAAAGLLTASEHRAGANQDGTDTNQNGGDDYEEEEAAVVSKPGGKTLRIREDTAKYLLDLDLDSAKYDPKTRTMNTAGATGDATAEYVAEHNVMRGSGDAAEFERAQRYAWETQERGDKDKLHLQANPTIGEISRRKLKEEAQAKKAAQKQALLQLYGEQEAKPLKKDAPVESDRFVEYDERGRVKGRTELRVKSSYAEDVRIQNHTSTWGSWWRDFKWGYTCCHSTVKNSYCTGEQGKRVLAEEEELRNESESGDQLLLEDNKENAAATLEAADKLAQGHETAKRPREEVQEEDETQAKRQR